jgi:thermitase
MQKKPFLVFASLLMGSNGFAGTELPDRVPGEYVVRLKNLPLQADTLYQQIAQSVEKKLNKKKVHHFSSQGKAFKTDASLGWLRISADDSEANVLQILNQDPRVQYAEPNWIYRTTSILPESQTVSDPLFNELWGLKNIGQTDRNGTQGKVGSDMKVEQAWQQGYTGNKNIVVAVIDTGMDLNHPDLAAQLYKNPNEIPGNNIDDDGNGFIDDVSGWNFAAGTNLPQDDQDHGTHCSGTIGAVKNDQGVVGVAWNVSIMPIKFLDASGSGTLANAIQAVQYATLMNVKITSNSWGGPGFSQALKDAIEQSKQNGILFVAAAGNSGRSNDSTANYPSNYAVDNVLAVAATGNRDQLASFSNYGKKTVHVAAPGVDVLSSIRNGKYGKMSGTSMATPHVAGAAVVLWATNTAYTYLDIKERLIKSSDMVPALMQKTQAGGRVNLLNAIHGIYPPKIYPQESEWKTEAYKLESLHPYENNQSYTFLIDRPGAKFIRIIFDRIDVEDRYDYVQVNEDDGSEIEIITGVKSSHVSEYIQGSKAKIKLVADSSNIGYGFKISKIQVVE